MLFQCCHLSLSQQRNLGRHSVEGNKNCFQKVLLSTPVVFWCETGHEQNQMRFYIWTSHPPMVVSTFHFISILKNIITAQYPPYSTKYDNRRVVAFTPWLVYPRYPLNTEQARPQNLSVRFPEKSLTPASRQTTYRPPHSLVIIPTTLY
jgi:hypothetical protein